MSPLVEEPLPTEVLDNVKDLWGSLEKVEMDKVGIHIEKVQQAYNTLATQSVLECLNNSSYEKQCKNVINVFSSLVGCPITEAFFIQTGKFFAIVRRWITV